MLVTIPLVIVFVFLYCLSREKNKFYLIESTKALA